LLFRIGLRENLDLDQTLQVKTMVAFRCAGCFGLVVSDMFLVQPYLGWQPSAQPPQEALTLAKEQKGQTVVQPDRMVVYSIVGEEVPPNGQGQGCGKIYT